MSFMVVTSAFNDNDTIPASLCITLVKSDPETMGSRFFGEITILPS